MLKRYSLERLLGKRTLIIGDLGSGKTLLTANLLEQAIDMGYRHQITAIDMAPPTMQFQDVRAGGALAEVTKAVLEVRYLRSEEIKAPRIMAKNAEELKRLVEFNKRTIDRMLTEFLLKPTPFLFINDVSIYLQAGETEKIIEAIRKSKTFIANGYFGKRLGEDFGTGVSKMERVLMRKLMREMNEVIALRKS